MDHTLILSLERLWVHVLLASLFILYLLSIWKVHVTLLGGTGSTRVTSANLATAFINVVTIVYFYALVSGYRFGVG